MSRAQYPSQDVPSGMDTGSTTSGRTARRARLPKVLLAVLGAATAALLAGCSAGQIAQTAEQESAVNGASADLGPIAIRDAQLAPPHNRGHYYAYGDEALLQLTIVNRASKDDKLVAVDSPIAKDVRIVGHRAIPGGTSLRSGDVGPNLARPQTSGQVSAAPSGKPSGTAPPSASAKPSGSGAPSASTMPSGTPTKPHSKVSHNPLPIGHVNITLVGLKVDHLYSGHTVPVRFTFAHAGRVTVNLPVGVPPVAGHTDTKGIRR